MDNIAIQNANVITQSKTGEAGPAVVSATIFNKGATEQTLDSITLPGGAGTVKLTGASGSGGVTVPAQGSIVIGGKGNASAVIEDGTALTKKIGGVQDVVFKLSKTGDVKLEAFVVPSSADGYADFGPGSAPAPAASPSPSGQPGAEGTEGAEGAEKPEGGEKPEGADASNAPETPAG
nr:lipoprotein [Streptomyces tsukubensis NRRL18488]